MSRGSLRVYLGAAPGVGKTFSMLAEGIRRADRGADVVAVRIVDHGRDDIRSMVARLPRVEVADAVARRPTVVLVDELARHRVEVAALLDAGIDVITTVDVDELESLTDAVTAITGVRPPRTIPDEVVRTAEQIELVDMAPEALRRRLAHGRIYPPERIDAAMADYYRVGNLTALRELALLWLADRVDEGLSRYRAEHGIEATWPARERIVVAVIGEAQDEILIRRGARVAGRTSGAELMAVHVAAPGDAPDGQHGRLATARTLVEDLGGTFHVVLGTDVARALLEFTHGVNGTQLVLGSGRSPRRHAPMRPGPVAEVLAGAGDVDVHLVTIRRAELPRSRTRRQLGRGRTVSGAVAAVLGPLLLVALLTAGLKGLSLASDLLLFLTLTVAVALLGGLWPAVGCAVLSGVAVNYFFTPPVHTFTISAPQDRFALVIFVAVALAVASVVDLAARRTGEAARSQAEAATLSALARGALRGDDGADAVLDRLRRTFGMQAAVLSDRPDDRRAWRQVATSGRPPWPDPDNADATEMILPNLVIALRGQPLEAGDRRVLQAFASHLGVVLERQRLTERATAAQRLEEGHAIRTALLAAVSHDLRTPLAGIKAAVSSLRQEDVEWSPSDSRALLATIEESADRLDALVANLLDLSRLQTGTVQPQLRPVALDEVVPPALAGVDGSSRLTVAIPESLPLVTSDPGLLERVVANLVENAVRHGGAVAPIVVSGSASGDRVQLRVVDRGPGVPDSQKESIFAPFQRLGDRPGDGYAGVGLGLAVARGFTEATGGQLWAEDTPGGGLTMVVSLAAAGAGARVGRSA
jgi:two-component system, OmpR family, sensor histidine kinase KdpD